MLILENFIPQYKNFNSPDSSSTEILPTLTHAAETMSTAAVATQ